MLEDNSCALWFVRYMQPNCEIYKNESEAASAAVFMEEYETGAPQGVQFPDGRIIKLEDWKAYREALNELNNRPIIVEERRETRRV